MLINVLFYYKVSREFCSICFVEEIFVLGVRRKEEVKERNVLSREIYKG